MTRHPLVLYNVQRLFRPVGGTIARALDATTDHGWNPRAYQQKVRALGAVLNDATQAAPPALLVLIEVEDAETMADVVSAAGWGEQLKLVTVAGEQMEGWDVGLAYNPDVFAGGVADAASYTFNNRFATRDLLTVKLTDGVGRCLMVAATHWPSRTMSGSEPLRIAASYYCDRIIEDSLKFRREDLLAPEGGVRMPSLEQLRSRWAMPVVVAGDFNDEPWDPALRLLGRSTPDLRTVLRTPRFPAGDTLRSVAQYLGLHPRLFNPTWLMPHDQRAPGTYWYGDDWYRLDQFLASAGALDGPGPRLVPDSVRVHAPDKVRAPDGSEIAVSTPQGRPIGFDTSRLQGVSDHLPLLMDLDV